MSVRNIHCDEEGHAVTLDTWQVLELANGARHLIGYSLARYEGRVSTEVVFLNIATLRVTTASGRAYELRGLPGASDGARYVWQRFARINAIEQWSDVTEDVWQAHLRQVEATALPSSREPHSRDQ